VHFVRGAVCDVRGEIRGRNDIELPEPTAAVALDAIEALASSLLTAAGVSEDALDGIVLGVPGAVEAHTNRIYLATNIAGLEEEGFARALSTRLGQATRIENDINLAALGERWRGVAPGSCCTEGRVAPWPPRLGGGSTTRVGHSERSIVRRRAPTSRVGHGASEDTGRCSPRRAAGDPPPYGSSTRRRADRVHRRRRGD
jgi:hypothetical protein